MPISASRVTATNPTPVLIATGRAEGVACTVANPSATGVYLGGPTVTTSTGFALGTTGSYSALLVQGDLLYAVGTAGTETIQVILTRQ